MTPCLQSDRQDLTRKAEEYTEELGERVRPSQDTVIFGFQVLPLAIPFCRTFWGNCTWHLVSTSAVTRWMHLLWGRGMNLPALYMCQQWNRCTSLNCSTYPLPQAEFGIVTPVQPPLTSASKASINGRLYAQQHKLPGQLCQHKKNGCKELLHMTWRCWCPR